MKNVLSELPNEIQHEAMVIWVEINFWIFYINDNFKILIIFKQIPFSKLAFFPGKLIHTNEILVLLGDNWFVERSAKQSCEIINRRLKCN